MTGDHATTPEWVLRYVRDMGRIELDPCWNPNATTDPAARFDGSEHSDGLVRPWRVPGLVFVNPPYSRGQIAKWVAKAHAEAWANPETEVLMLIPCDPSTAWWEAAWDSASAVCLCAQRIRFGPHATGAKQASAVFYWGERTARFDRVFGGLGYCVQCAGYLASTGAVVTGGGNGQVAA
jgi:hypothetical protein